MRFLFLTQYYPPEVGAAQVRLHSCAKALVGLGHDVRVLTAMPNYPQGSVSPEYKGLRYVSEQIDGIDVVRTWIHPVAEAGMRRMLSYLSFQLSSFPALLRETRRWRPDFVFVESPPLFLGASGVLLKRIMRTGLIFNVADLWPDWAVAMGVISASSGYYKMARWLENTIYKHSDYVNIVVEDMKDALLQKGVPASKVLFLPNGVDLGMFGTHRSHFESELARELAEKYAQKRIILYAGTHGRYHGLGVAIDAANLLRERQDIQLIFVGDGSEKRSLVAQAKSLHLHNVEFYDPVAPGTIAELLQMSCAALSVIGIPTRPAKIFPAMASAKPIVYAGVGEGADLVKTAGAGIVVSPRDAAAIADAISVLVDDPAYAETLGMNGRRFVEAHLDWSVLVRAWVADLNARMAPPLLVTTSSDR